MLKVALLGAGRIGQVHAQSIVANKSSNLVAVADVFAEAAEKLAAHYGAKALSVDEVLQDDQIDAVLIASSTDTHADLIEAATKAGKAVLCEKPVDLALDRAIACLEATKNDGQPIMIGFNRRFDRNFSTLKNAYDAGEIGKGELLSVTSFDPSPPPVSYVKVSGGLYRDMMIHDFDMVCWIFGSTPSKVSAFGSSIVDPAIGEAGDVDTAVVTLSWDDGRIAVIKNSRRAVYGYDQRVELLGSEGILSAKNVMENTVEKITEAGTSTAKPMYFFLERYMQAYKTEWSHFVDAVLNKEKLPVTLNDGINALVIAEAATLSSQRGQVVHMNGTRIEVSK